MIHPKYEDFRYTGTDNQAAIDSVIATRQNTYAATNQSSDMGEQKLATFIATPTELAGNEIIIRFTEFADENGRPSGSLFDSLIAQTTGRRVISTNLPGIDFYGSVSDGETQDLLPEQAQDLRRGSFKKVGAAIMQATLNATTELRLEPQFVVLGTSMSAGVAAGALRFSHDKSLDIRGVGFAEPTNTVARPRLQLAGEFISNIRTAGGYAAMNPASIRQVSEPVMTITKRMMKPTNLLYAQALASGSLLSDLGDSDHLQDIPVFMTRGISSTVSPASGFEDVKNHLSQTADVETVTYGDSLSNPHDHGYTLTVQSFIDAAARILERQA